MSEQNPKVKGCAIIPLMNRNSAIAAAVVIAVVVAGVVISRGLKTRPLPSGQVSQTAPAASPTAASQAASQPLTGKPRVIISTTKGDVTLELRPQVDNGAVAQLLGKISRGECDNQTVSDCGLADKSYIRVISGQLTPGDKIISTTVLTK